MAEMEVTGTLDEKELDFDHSSGTIYRAVTEVDTSEKEHLAVLTATDEAGNSITESMVITVTATWTTPKTDWNGYTDNDGIYHGDRFNTEDFNRIKNNLEYLRKVAICEYPEFDMNDLGDDKEKNQFFYADEINKLEENLDIIARSTAGFNYGDAPIFYDNGRIFDFNDLNRIEKAILDMHDQLTNQYRGRRMLSFPLGAQSEVL